MNTITEHITKDGILSHVTISQRKIASLICSRPNSIKIEEEYYTPFPLDSLLIIFNKAHRECCLDYMDGLRLLVQWLSPVVTSDRIYSDLACDYPLLNSYSAQKLAKILGIKESAVLDSLLHIISHDLYGTAL